MLLNIKLIKYTLLYAITYKNVYLDEIVVNAYNFKKNKSPTLSSPIVSFSLF